MLTDYHLHLRPDGAAASPAAYYTPANVERYREVASARGIAELGVSEHIYRFKEALQLWRHPFWEGYAHDDLDDYCAFVRERTDLRLGIEADFIPGAEDRTADLLASRDLDYVVGSVHFLRDGAVDMDDYSVWDSGRSVEEIWRRYFQTIGESAASGLVRHPRPPRPDQVLGTRPAAARKEICAATTSSPSTGSPLRGSPSRSRRRGCASPRGRSTRRLRSSRCACRRVPPWPSRATLTDPRTWGRAMSGRSNC